MHGDGADRATDEDQDPRGGESSPPRGRRGGRRWARASALTAAPALAVVLVAALAILSGSASVSGNVITVQPCSTAALASVQRGTTAVTADGAVDVAITAVDTARSFVLASVRSQGADPGDALVRVELAATDRVTLTRSTDTVGPPAVEVAWTVVEYSCGVSVQRGTLVGDGVTAAHDVTIATVDPGRAFALFTATPDRAATDGDADDTWSATIPDGTTLRLRSGAPAPAGATVSWQVVELAGPAASVQRISGMLGSGDASVDLPVPTPVDPGRTLVLAGGAFTAVGPGTGDRTTRAELVDGSTLRLSRLDPGAAVGMLEAFVVEFDDGTTVQSGVLELGPTETTKAASVSPVDLGRATVLSTSTGLGGQAWGETDHTASDVVGEGQATFELAATDSVLVTRMPSASTARFTYQVVEWGGPAWWDAAYPQRQQIRVDATTAAAPDGYTVPVTIDHAALVTAGDALASGDDVRVLHFDGTTWTELDRVLSEGSSWNAATTTVEFRTRAPVPEQTTDGSYWLYLGNAAAGTPPTDPRQVYALDDDFEDGTLAQFTEEGPGGWYVAQPWTWRVPLTVPSGTVAADLTDFPVYVELASAGLAAAAQPDGSDLRFTAADGTTPLDHELVSYDDATGSVEAWVRVPTVTAGTDTDLWLYAGSGNAPAQQDVRGTWSVAHVGAWHLAEDPTGALPQAQDSSPDGRDGASVGAMTAGDLVAVAAGDGLDLDGVDDGVDVGAVAVSGPAVSLSAWVRADATTGDPVLVGRGAAGAGDVSWALSLTATSATTADVTLELDLAGTPTVVAGGEITTGALHHVAAVFDGGTVRTYVDGAPAATVPAGGLLTETASHVAALGRHPSAARHLDGLLDEVRVSSTVRSPAWVAAEHDTVATPGAFVVVGTPQTGTWFSQGAWSTRHPVTVPAGSVASDLSDFPLLLETTDPAVTAAALASGADIVVTAGDGTTRLDHEIERFESGTGELVLWVRVPTLTAAADTNLFLYSGNATAEDWQDPTGVWGSDAAAVLHLGEAPDG